MCIADSFALCMQGQSPWLTNAVPGTFAAIFEEGLTAGYAQVCSSGHPYTQHSQAAENRNLHCFTRPVGKGSQAYD